MCVSIGELSLATVNNMPLVASMLFMVFNPCAMDQERLLTQDEVAEMLRVSPSTLINWRREGTLNGPPFVRVGRLIRYKVAEVQAWLNAQSNAPAA